MRRRGFLRWGIRSVVTPAVCAFAGLPSVARGDAPRAAQAARDGWVIGRVDGEAVSSEHVRAHLRPAPPHVGAASPPDARLLAWDAAVRVRLLVREARRRGIDGGRGPAGVVEARLVHELTRAELARSAAGTAPIDDAEARRFYEENRTRLAAVESADVAAIVVGDRALAQDLLRRAEGAGDAAFEQLVRQHSLDAASKMRGGHLARIDRDGRGLPTTLARTAVALKTAGAVGLAEDDDGRFYVLRAARVQLESKPWSPRLAAYVRELLERTRRDAALDALVARLHAAADVQLDAHALARLPVPSWDEYLGFKS